LPEFVAFLHGQGIPGPIRARLALEWACQASAHRGPGGAARRLSIARGFLAYLQASAPDTEVPDSGLLPSPRRPKPYLFTAPQLTALFDDAPTPRLPAPHLIHLDRPPPDHRSAGGRSHPPSGRGRQARSWAAAVTHPRDEVPQIPHCAASSQHGGASAPLCRAPGQLALRGVVGRLFLFGTGM